MAQINTYKSHFKIVFTSYKLKYKKSQTTHKQTPFLTFKSWSGLFVVAWDVGRGRRGVGGEGSIAYKIQNLKFYY